MQAGRAVTRVGSFAARGRREGEAVTVAIRPQGVRLSPLSETPEGAQGRIVSRHFLGETDLFDVAVDGAETYLVAKARAGDGLFPGAEVRVGFDPRDVLVFPESETAT